MGLFRKITSVGTMGAVDFRSAKDRTAASSRKTAKQSKEQTRLMRQQLAVQRATMYTQPVQASPPPGWMQDTTPGWLRWWDGTQWTEHTRPVGP